MAFGGEGMTEHTPTPWGLAIYRDDPNRPPTVDKIKHMLCESVDRTIQHGGSIPDIYFVCASVDPKDPVFTAITGNGPHSEANAAFIVKACNCHEELVEACQLALQFIRNGVEYGYIRMPDKDTPDPAHHMDDILHAALKKAGAS
jgi:hypothetical protein